MQKMYLMLIDIIINYIEIDKRHYHHLIGIKQMQ